MSIWRIEFHNYLIDAFLEPNTLFGNFIYYTIIGLLLAFSFGNDTDNSKEVEDYFKLFKYVSFAQTAFGLVNNSSKLNDPRKYLQKMSSSKRGLNISDICRNIFLITITSGMFRIFISFWYSVMVYPISGLRGGVNRFLVYWLALYCQTMATFTLATSISAGTSNHIKQAKNASVAFIVCILFSGGYYLETSVTWILRWIEYISPSYYGRAALANNEYANFNVNDELTGDYVLDSKQAHGLGLWGSIGALMGLFWWKHFMIKSPNLKSFKLFRFSILYSDLRSAIFPEDNSYITAFKSFKGPFILEINDFDYKFNGLKIVFNVKSINIYINSAFLIKRNGLTRKKSSTPSFLISFVFHVLKSLLSIFELNCTTFSLITTVGNIEEADVFVAERLCCQNIEIFKFPTSVASIYSVELDQIIIENNSLSIEPIFETKNFLLNRNSNFSQFDLSIPNCLGINLNVRFLYFLASFINSIKQETVETEEIEPTETIEISLSLPWPILLNLSIPEIDFKLILPETDLTVKYFKWLQFKLSEIDLKCFFPSSGIPKLTAWLGCFKLVTKIDDAEILGKKHFCPVDKLLGRGPEQIAGQCRELIILKNILLCNWNQTNDLMRTSLPETVIFDWISSILSGSPICSIQNDTIDLSTMSMSMDTSCFDEFKNRPTAKEKLTFDFFKIQRSKASTTLFGLLDQFDFNIPFEFPISSLIDHSVVLFKAGWRPLSKKTERGYWIGDGDKFLKTSWAFNLQANRAKLSIEDDAFEAKISAISHFQRKLAESRSRLEPALLSEFPPSQSNDIIEVSPEMLKLAKILTVSSDDITQNQASAIIELNKNLFAEYRGLVSKSHLLTNWSLVDVAVDDLKLSLSWSPDYLGKRGSLSSLLNRMENGNEINTQTIETLSTFLGGFADISGSDVQVNLRNYSRPVLLAPDLRIVGPVFLVEDGVKDPEVLIKFPVRVLPEGLHSSFSLLPSNGTVDVLRSILPLKIYHCVHSTISQPDLVQASVSPYWLGCIALLDRVIDRFVKASTEDPSPPLPGWDKLRYNIHGCHSRLTMSSPCIVSRIIDADPLSCTEVLNLSFPRGVDIGIIPGGVFVLKCPESSLSVDSQYLYNVHFAHESSGPLYLWDLRVKLEEGDGKKKPRNLSDSSLDLSQNTLIPIIKLSQTHLELRFKIKNVFNEDPSHHWSVRPVARSNSLRTTDWEHHDTFKSFRSKSISLELSGFVGSNLADSETCEDIRFLYYREFERWISRYLMAHFSDMDVVKRGPLHQSAAIPELQHRTSFSSVFTEMHISVDFSDLFICRLLNFSSPKESQALWSASRRSLLNMDWRRGIVDQHGREDWVYYYGELEFLNVHFCVTSNSSITKNENTSDFPVNIPDVQFNDFLRAPRLFYLSLDENCFQYDPESLDVQCQTVLKRRKALLTSLTEVTRELSLTPSNDIEKINQLTVAIEALQKRQKYYDSFLFKAQSNNTLNHDFAHEDPIDLEFADTSHFEIYNAQLVWSIFNRDIMFKFVDEIFVQEKKKFSQTRNGRMLMRKMAQTNPQIHLSPVSEASTSTSPRNKSFSLSPTETIDSFFESLLERKGSTSSSPLIRETGPFTATPETEIKPRRTNDMRKGFDFRSPVHFRDSETISVPRIVDVSFFNPQLCFLTPTHNPAGAILVTAREAKVEFSPIFDRFLLKSQVDSDAKMGTRTRISLENASIFSGSKINYNSWPAEFLQKCYAQKLFGLQRLTAETEITAVYDVSNVAYSWTPTSPHVKIFGHGDTIKFSSNGMSLTTTSDNFRSVLDVIVNLLVYRDPNQEIRSEKLETLLIAANLSDRRMFAAKMEEFRRRLDILRCQLLGRREFELSFEEIEGTLELFDRTERELALIGEAMRMIQASREKLNQKRSRLTLNVLIDKIQWTLLVSKLNEPSFDLLPACKISLEDIMNRWVSKEDGSMENTFEIGSANFINQLPVPFYRNVLRPFDVHHGQDGVHLRATVDYGCLLRFFAKSRLPVNGILVLDHVEVDLSPLQLQLTFDIATQIYKFFLPEKISKKSTTQDDSGITSSRPRSRTEISELILSEQQVPFDEVLEMKQRSEKNVFFVYVKVPPSQHLLSYKSPGKSSLLDIDRFILSLPEMEYQNKLWSWPEFFNQIRKDMIVVLLKNAGSLFKDKLKKFGKKNLPERPEISRAFEDANEDYLTRDEVYLRNLARKEKIDVLEEDNQDEREKKNFLVFGKSILKFMKK